MPTWLGAPSGVTSLRRREVALEASTASLIAGDAAGLPLAVMLEIKPEKLGTLTPEQVSLLSVWSALWMSATLSGWTFSPHFCW